MNSERIKALAKNIGKEDVVLDVGCDHGYLSIYLKQNKLCKEVYASDISIHALNMAQENFKKYNVQIKTFVSNGFQNITESFNTAVIAGMGTSTILKILDSKKIPQKLILGSNNDHYKLREGLNCLGYNLVDEIAIEENGHYYLIMTYIKGLDKLNKKELKFGRSANKDYYNYLINKNKSLMKKVPLRKKISLYYDNFILKGLTQKK